MHPPNNGKTSVPFVGSAARHYVVTHSLLAIHLLDVNVQIRKRFDLLLHRMPRAIVATQRWAMDPDTLEVP